MQSCSEMPQHLFARVVFYGRNKCLVWHLFSVFSMKRVFHGALTWLLVTCKIMSDWDSPLISHLTRHTQTRWYTDTYCRPLTSNVYGRVCVLFIDILDAVVRVEMKNRCFNNFAKTFLIKHSKMTNSWHISQFITKRQHLKQRDHFCENFDDIRF